ncbi:hypothetical protein MRX96_017229 [Rhipicephalus microplus]
MLARKRATIAWLAHAGASTHLGRRSRRTDAHIAHEGTDQVGDAALFVTQCAACVHATLRGGTPKERSSQQEAAFYHGRG